MKAVCRKDELLKALDIAVRIAAKHHTLPILSTVRIEVRDGQVELRATNLEIGCIARIKAEVSEDGIVSVPVQTLLQTVTLIPGASLTLRKEEGVLCVDSERSKSRLKTQNADEFPTIAPITGTTTEIDGKAFSSGIKSVAFAASQSSIKPELGAVYIYQKKQHTITLVATDSFRLAEKTVSAGSLSLEQGFLIPQKNALEIARTIDTLNESPRMTVANSQIGFTFPSGVEIISRLIEGVFPDYEQIIPKEYQSHATFLLRDFEHALRKTNIFANKFLQVAFSLTPMEGVILLKSENNDAGMTEETMRVDAEGAPLSLSFNQQYIVESLSHIASDSIEAHFGGIGRPLVMNGHNESSFRYLVMPMNK